MLTCLYLAKSIFICNVKLRVERCQLGSGLVGGKVPMDTSSMFIAVALRNTAVYNFIHNFSNVGNGQYTPL